MSLLHAQVRPISSPTKPLGVDLIVIYQTRWSVDLCHKVTLPSVPSLQTNHLFLGMATLLYADMSSYLKWKSELSLQVFNVMIHVKFPARHRVH